MSDRQQITLIEENDGRWTAVDEETVGASYGDTRPEALDILDEAVALYQSDEDSIKTQAEEREALHDLGIDPDGGSEAREEVDELHKCMQ